MDNKQQQTAEGLVANQESRARFIREADLAWYARQVAEHAARFAYSVFHLDEDGSKAEDGMGYEFKSATYYTLRDGLKAKTCEYFGGTLSYMDVGPSISISARRDLKTGHIMPDKIEGINGVTVQLDNKLVITTEKNVFEITF